MSKIISLEKSIKVSRKLRKEGRRIILSGGCFDILHIGHINFLKNAKKNGDFLFLLLESDESVRKLKGKGRPINSQTDRAQILASISFVDYVIILEGVLSNKDYDNLISFINPYAIAVTKNDPKIKHIKRQTQLINGKMIEVIARLPEYSSTKLISIIKTSDT